MSTQELIGKEIRKARQRAGLSQSELAKCIGTKQSGIARAESGRMTPSLGFLERIAEATDHRFKMPRLLPNK